MYVDDRPLSTFRPTSGWNLPASPPYGTLKRPPTRNNGPSSSSLQTQATRPPLSSSGSSSSSLDGLERAIPSFQSFIKRTPSVESNKPLPPTPLPAKRSVDSLRDTYRRSSSVYSQSPSQFGGSRSGERFQDAENDVPIIFRPVSYSTSSSELSTPEEKEKEPAALLEPRTFSPLIVSPSPTLSAVTTNSSLPKFQTLPGPSAEMPKRPKVPVISLEQAQWTIRAPGAVHLLPEELRAQTLSKAKSHGHLRVESTSISSASSKAPRTTTRAVKNLTLPEQKPPVPPMSQAATSPYKSAFHVGREPVREMLSYVPNNNNSDSDEPRGKTMQRRSLQRQSNPYQLSQKIYTPDYNTNPIANDATDHNDFAPQSEPDPGIYRQPSSSPGGGYSSDDSVRTHMKMVPQPLFQGKKPPAHSRASRDDAAGTGSGTESDVSPFGMLHKRVKSDDSATSSASPTSGRSVRSSSGFGLRLSVEPPERMDRSSNNSSTGMIPISPPTDHQSLFQQQRPKVPKIDTSTSIPRRRDGGKHERQKSESGFYPHIMSRKGKRDKSQDAPVLPVPSPGKHLLAAEIIAQALKTPPEISPQSPLGSHPVDVSRAPSHGSSDKAPSKKPLLIRIANRAARGRRRSSQQETGSTPTASLNSPHLFPSPSSTSSSKPKTPMSSYLGWSDLSKKDFDDAHSPAPSIRNVKVTHIVAPARPLDGSKDAFADQEPESPSAISGRRPSIFGGVLNSWRENKAEKRRKDLKKLIKVVAPVEGGGGGAVTTASMESDKERPSISGRRFSSYGWM